MAFVNEKSITECSVCMESPMETPIFQCFEGHVLCSRCEQRLKDCPQCRMPLPKDRKIRCRALESLQPEPETIYCPNANCTAHFKFPVRLEEHVRFGCAYKKIPLCHILEIDPDVPCAKRFAPNEAEAAAQHLASCHGKFCKRLSPMQLQNASSTGGFRFNVHNNRLVILEFMSFDGTRMVKIKPFVLAPRVEAENFRITVTSWMWYDYGLETPFEVMKSKSTRSNTSKGPMWSLIDFKYSDGCTDSPSIHLGTDTSKCIFAYEINVADETN